MPVDLYQSRRDYHILCKWWAHDEREEFTPDELVYKRTPDGAFWAKEVSPEQDRDNIIGGVFNLDSTHVTLKTPDDCVGLQSKYLVEYQGEFWIVVSVQKSKARKSNTMFASDRNCSHYWYIELRK